MANKSGIPGTISNFLLVLEHELIRYDQKEELKHPNIYRLGLLLSAAGKVREDLAHLDLNATLGPLTSVVVRSSLESRFIPGFSPVNRVLKQIDAFLASGKNPSLL